MRREFEEIALGLAGAAAETLAGNHEPKAPTDAEERRVAKAVRRIEAAAEEPISLGDLAEEAGLSPYHFLRGFRRVAGMTPYQFVLRTRLHRAAVRLRTTGDSGLGDRLRCRLQRPFDLQPPLQAGDGTNAERLSRPARRVLRIVNGAQYRDFRCRLNIRHASAPAPAWRLARIFALAHILLKNCEKSALEKHAGRAEKAPTRVSYISKE